MICPGLLPIQDRLGMTADSTQPRVNKWWCSGVIVVTGLGLDNSAVALTGHTLHRDPSSNKALFPELQQGGSPPATTEQPRFGLFGSGAHPPT